MGKLIRIASWNIWVYGKGDYKGIAKFIRDNKIDVIGLQEVAIYFRKGKRLDMAKAIARELGYHYIFFRSKDGRPKHSWIQGNAIISRFPISGAKAYNLNPSRAGESAAYETEQRILISSKIHIANTNINFLTTHLQFSKKFKSNKIRFAQVKKIIGVVKKLKNRIILTGDFNSVPKNKEIRSLENILSRLGGNKPTWTIYPFDYDNWYEDRLKYHLDNIFTSSDLKSQKFRVLYNKISDHLPIMTDVIL